MVGFVFCFLLLCGKVRVSASSSRCEKAMVKRRSQVREYQGQGGVYGGEATGIRRNVAKSVRLKG